MSKAFKCDLCHVCFEGDKHATMEIKEINKVPPSPASVYFDLCKPCTEKLVIEKNKKVEPI
jgi:hypothetical protein